MAAGIFAIYLVVMSVATYVVYASDKQRAKRGERRVPEKVLLSLSFFGGAIGGYWAMRRVRHKTKKWYFHALHIFSILWQAAALVWLILTF
ncbi:MAG: DUF1294 domain-containing protein [Clostridia bacterium]|nr:DUF1294 domain-containing protein [Clostridia bacterium]